MRFVLFVAIVGVVACSTERFAPGVEKVAVATKKIDADLEPLLRPLLEERRIAARDKAAGDNFRFAINESCLDLTFLRATPPATRCEIDVTPFGDAAPPPNLPADLARKMDVLGDYVGALGILASAESEDELFAALAVARTSLGELGEAASSETLTELSEDLTKNKEAIEGVGRAAFDALRYSRLKSVVTESDGAVGELAVEIQKAIYALNLDPVFKAKAERLTTANQAVAISRGQGAPYVQAVAELEAAQGDFVASYDRTLIGRVGLVAQAHRGLAQALRNPNSPEDVVTYLEALRALADTIRE
jgi:hypothetical protein